MRQRHRAGLRQPGAATDQRGHRAGVVRGDERRRQRQRALGRQPTGDRADGGQLQCLIGTQLRQQADQPLREHGLAGAGRADQQQVVATGRRDLQRGAGAALPHHVGQLQRLADRADLPRPWLGQRERAGQPMQHVVELLGPEYPQPGDQRRLAQRGAGHHHGADTGIPGRQQAG
jgi:hypothetical protein